MKIAVALSGGVDSALCAKLLLDAGHEVIGVTMRLLPTSDDVFQEGIGNGVKMICDYLQIKSYVIDLRDDFKTTVLQHSWDLYKQGMTPNPCAYCNEKLKFGALLNFAESLGCEKLATGHYVRCEKDSNGIYHLLRGVDSLKDQTYFLLKLKQEQLKKVIMPLGYYTKQEVRALAENFKLPNAKKAESQDTCFGVKGDIFSDSLCKLFDGTARVGSFVNMNGKKLGTHEGIHLYTIGQRKGLKIALGSPAYVVKINNQNAEVQISINEADLACNAFEVENVSWQSGEEPLFPLETQVQIRYRSKAVDCTLYELTNGRIQVVFKEPQRAVTIGQGASFYQNEILLGGGFIVSV